MTVLAREIMTPSVKAVPQSWTMDRFTRFLTDNEITGSPVSDENGKIIGIATLKDVAEFRWSSSRPKHSEAQLTEEDQREARRLRMFIFEEMSKLPAEVHDIMTPIVISVSESTPVRDIANLMMEEHMHRIFVTQDGEVTGIITTYDMLRLISNDALTRRCVT
jgi:CBS-domain-containing membrane protein